MRSSNNLRAKPKSSIVAATVAATDGSRSAISDVPAISDQALTSVTCPHWSSSNRDP
jgi:hypothetical protein